MKRGFVSIALLLMLAIAAAAQGKAKYVFYFIGDGMGVNQVNAAETYLAAIEVLRKCAFLHFLTWLWLTRKAQLTE